MGAGCGDLTELTGYCGSCSEVQCRVRAVASVSVVGQYLQCFREFEVSALLCNLVYLCCDNSSRFITVGISPSLVGCISEVSLLETLDNLR